jgi:hypothetical protein
LVAVSPKADAPLATDGPSLAAGRSDGLVIGELTVSSLGLRCHPAVAIVGWTVGTKCQLGKGNTGNKKPPPA